MIVVDTHVWVWWVHATGQLSDTLKRAEEQATYVYGWRHEMNKGTVAFSCQ